MKNCQRHTMRISIDSFHNYQTQSIPPFVIHTYLYCRRANNWYFHTFCHLCGESWEKTSNENKYKEYKECCECCYVVRVGLSCVRVNACLTQSGVQFCNLCLIFFVSWLSCVKSVSCEAEWKSKRLIEDIKYHKELLVELKRRNCAS